MWLLKVASGNKCKFLLNLCYEKDTSVHVNSFISISPRGDERQGGVRYITPFLWVKQFAKVILPLFKNPHRSVKEAKELRVAVAERCVKHNRV